MSSYFVFLCAVLGVIVCGDLMAGDIEGQGMIFPGEDWAVASAESQGVDGEKLDQAMGIIAEIADDFRDGTKSAGNTQVVVIRNGRMIWGGSDIDNMHTVYSCNKSFTSSVMGLLVDDGKCDIDDRAAEIYPALQEFYPEVTLGQFATFTSGYDVPWRGSPFEIRPALHDPGEMMRYGRSVDQLAYLLTRVAGEPLRDLFKCRIADVIGMRSDQWVWPGVGEVDGVEVCSGAGAGGIEMTASQMARFGHLYLNNGMWDGVRVLSEEWVLESTRVQLDVGVQPYEEEGWYTVLAGRYGYLWWVDGVGVDGKRLWPGAPVGTYAAQGNRNNYCFVIPAWNMVLVRLGQGKAIDSKLYDRVFMKLREAVGEE